MSNNKQIEKKLKLPHRETVISTNTLQTKPFDNQKIEIMSNNKQSMKLYTEEQVREMIEKSRETGLTADYLILSNKGIELPSDSLCINCDDSKSNHNICMDCIIKIGKENIELPSDEELKKQFDVDEFDPYDLAYLGGAIRMRNLIQGGNK